jgi:AraC family transcriptional activator of pobA
MHTSRSLATQHPLQAFGRQYLQSPELLPPVYQNQLQAPDSAHFSVFSRAEHPCQAETGPGRLDLYKISFSTAGTGDFRYGAKTYAIGPRTLSFLHPHELWSWEATSGEQDGFFCLFNEAFLAHPLHLQPLRQHPHFQLGTTTPVLQLTPEQATLTHALFAKLLTEFSTPGPLQSELLRLTLQLLLLESQRFTPAGEGDAPRNTGTQLTYRFLALLEQQFPITSRHQRLGMKSPGQFARALAVQPNHLNACVKKTTGHSLRSHIQQRLLTEAQTLLKHSTWQVSEIAYALGFEEVASFTHFFRKATGLSPLVFRG